MQWFRRRPPRTMARAPMIPRPTRYLPGERLHAIRDTAAQVGWGAGIGAQALLVGAVCEEDARVLTINAPVAATALAVMGFETGAFGGSIPAEDVPYTPLQWGVSPAPETARRFDAAAIDASAEPPAGAWLAAVLTRLLNRAARVRVGILCRAEDADHYSAACRFADWDIIGVPETDGVPAAVLLVASRMTWRRDMRPR